METNNTMILKAVRLDRASIEEINKIVKETGGGATQSDVIRHLIHAGLGKNSNLTMRHETDLTADAKNILFDITNMIADIRSELNKIGGNINIRRKKYNFERKELLDLIASNEKMMKHDDMYSRLRREEKIKSLKHQLKQFDSQDTAFVANDEWQQFEELMDRFDSICDEVGGALNGDFN